jgi:uncharacterized membrane protein
MKSLYGIFLKGLMIVLPVSLTLSLISWVIATAEGLFGQVLKKLMGPFYIPGTGLLLTILSIFLAGLLVSNYITEKFVNYFLRKFENFPVIKAVYKPLKDLFALFGSSGANQNMKKVVLVSFGDDKMKMIGLVTRDEFSELGKAEAQLSGRVTVYFPMSYMFGGFTALVNKDQVEEIDLPVDKALRLAITGWINSPDSVTKKQ